MSCLTTIAQNKLTNDRNTYRANDQLVKQQVDFMDPGILGRKLIWDFRKINPVNSKYSLKYFATEANDLTNLCGLEHNTRYYYRQQNDSLQATGYENSTTYMQYVVPELRMHFPFAYGDTLFSNFEGKGQYCHSLDLVVKGYTRVQADAEGDILLPNSQTINKALRVHTLRHYTETGKDSLEMTLDTYSWYATGIRYPVFESVMTTIQNKQENGSVIETNVFSTSFYYPPEEQKTQVQTDSLPIENAEKLMGIESIFTEAAFVPNPVKDNLYINYKLTREANVWFTIHNNAGLLCCSTPSQNLSEGKHRITVNMNGLMSGVYNLYIHVDNMVMSKNIILK